LLLRRKLDTRSWIYLLETMFPLSTIILLAKGRNTGFRYAFSQIQDTMLWQYSRLLVTNASTIAHFRFVFAGTELLSMIRNLVIPSLCQVSRVQQPDRQCSRDQCSTQERNRNEPLAILRSLDLPPYEKRKPCLQHISHLIHSCDNNGAFLVVVRADLVGPCEAQAGKATAEPGEDVASPLPLGWYVPDRETDGAHDVHASPKDDWLPSRSFKDTVARPCVHKCGDDLNGVGSRWVLHYISVCLKY
jgi:hypothetical protein